MTGRRGGGEGASTRVVLLDLVRPATLGPVLVIALVVGIMGAGGWPGDGGFLRLLLAGALMVVANGGSNVVNQLGDMVEDSVHPTKQDRPVVAGLLSPLNLLSATLAMWGLALLVAILLLPAAFAALYLLVLGFAFSYSYPPRLKQSFPLGYLAIATPRGGLGIAAMWSVFGSLSDPRLLPMLAVTVPLVLLGNVSKDITDADADRYAGVQTVATLWGENACRAVVAAGFVLPSLTVYLGRLYASDVWLVLVAPLSVLGVVSAALLDGRRLWLVFYLVYSLVVLLFGLPTLLGAA